MSTHTASQAFVIVALFVCIIALAIYIGANGINNNAIGAGTLIVMGMIFAFFALLR